MIQTISYPQNISNTDEPYFYPHLSWTYSNPSVKKRLVRFVCSDGLVITPELKHDSELAPWLTFYKNFKLTFFIGKILKVGLNFRILTTANLYLVCNTYSDNFFHWMTEVLPRMDAICKDNPKATFFIPYQALSNFQKYTLQTLKIKYQLASKECSLLINSHVIGHTTMYPGYYHPELMNSIAAKLRLQSSQNPQKRIYITRKNAERRKLINEEEILPLLISYNFEIYDFDKIEIEEQIKIVSNAHVFISLHGAALTNMIFMQENGNVIEFLPENKLIDKCYFSLAKTMKLKYHYIFCETDNDNHVISNYKIKPILLHDLLKNIITHNA